MKKYNEIPLGKAMNLTNQRFGKLVPQFRTQNIGNKTAWVCKCDCGNITVVTADNLKRGNVQSCGCYQKEQTSKANGIDLTGQRFGKLLVLNKCIKDPNEIDRHIKWQCLCECGNVVKVYSNNLTSGHTTSCGCFHIEQIQKAKRLKLTNEKFGLLTVLSLNEEKTSQKHSTYWNCICECGNKTVVKGVHLIGGETQTCGCKKMSRGEIEIKNLLLENNILFEQEYKFLDCINPHTLKQFRWDFYVNNQYLIEFDGKQHFEQSKIWKEKLETIQQRDEAKNEWCKKKHIPLIRIPYTKQGQITIEDLMLETSNYVYYKGD